MQSWYHPTTYLCPLYTLCSKSKQIIVSNIHEQTEFLWCSSVKSVCFEYYSILLLFTKCVFIVNHHAQQYWFFFLLLFPIFREWKCHNCMAIFSGGGLSHQAQNKTIRRRMCKWHLIQIPPTNIVYIRVYDCKHMLIPGIFLHRISKCFSWWLTRVDKRYF